MIHTNNLLTQLPQRLLWIDRMRGLAILSVVIQHLTYYYQNDFIYHKLIGISNMALFFFVSGYIWDKTSSIQQLQEAVKFLMKKTRQLILPFLIWTFIVDRYFFHTEWDVLSFEEVMQEFLQPHLWFLLTLYGYCFVFPIYKLFANRGVKCGIIFWIIYIFTLFFIWYKFGLFKLSTLYIIYFAAGTLMANSNLMEKIFTNQMVSTLSLLCVFLLMAFWTPGETSLIKIIIRIAVSFSVISITYFLCTKLSWNKYWDSLIVSFGKYSLGIYVMHWTFLNIWETKPLLYKMN